MAAWPAETTGATLSGGDAGALRRAMVDAAAKKVGLRLTGTFFLAATVKVPAGLYIDATSAKFFVNSAAPHEKAPYNSGRFRNDDLGSKPEYGAAGWFIWNGGEFDGNGEGIWTISHSPGFIIKNATMYNYCSSANTGHAIETNSSGGVNNLKGPYNVQILNNRFLGTNRGQRPNSNDEPVHFDWNWKGSGGAAPVWDVGDPVTEKTQVMTHNVLVKGNTFHRKSEAGGWQFAKTAMGGHDASDSRYDPAFRHNHFLFEGNQIHGAVGSSEVSPNKGAIHLAWVRDAVVRNNVLHGGVARRYITAEDKKDSTFCSASGNTSKSPSLTGNNTIICEG